MYEELKQMLQESRRTLAFTGAGISTLSGIRDFRGKNGVYLEPWHGKSVEEILSLDCFLAEPALFYGWAAEFLYRPSTAPLPGLNNPACCAAYTLKISTCSTSKQAAATFTNCTAAPPGTTA